METTMCCKPNYGNWVSVKLIQKCMLLLLLFGISAFLLWIFVRGLLPLKILLTLITLFFFVCTVYFFRARWWFDAGGGNIQDKVLNLLVEQIVWSGQGSVLEIGCGSGALTVKLAQKYGEAELTGIDFWGGDWGYSQKQCEENAGLAQVAERTRFLRASAAQLPFADNSFDLVVSNLTFHEVKDAENKLAAVREALRVLKSNGAFVFQDLFLIKAYYGTTEELIAAVRGMGAKEAIFVNTNKAAFIPAILKLPFMIGALGLIHGKKA